MAVELRCGTTAMTDSTRPQSTPEARDTPARDARGKFLPGRSANPGGRPAIAAEIKTAFQAHGPAALKRLVALMGSEDEQVAVAACRAILDRAYGKPVQELSVSAAPVLPSEPIGTAED